MNTDGAKALLLRFNPKYPFAAMVAIERTRLFIETMQDLLNKGYAYKAAGWPGLVTTTDREAVAKAVEAYAFYSPDHEPVDIDPSRMTAYETQLIAELLRNPPDKKPSDGYTQADLDAAEKRGYERCKADVARLKP